MDVDAPRMQSVKNLHAILDAIQRAAEPDAFGIDFLKDLGFTSSNDRSVLKLLKFLGFLDGSGKPQSSYREFMNQTQAKRILAERMMVAYDDLFTSDQSAHTKTATALKGWFRTKTGVGDKVAEKMATTFRSLASYADWEAASPQAEEGESGVSDSPSAGSSERAAGDETLSKEVNSIPSLGLNYSIEIHLPDTTNIDTFRAIFRAIREELT